MSIETGPAPIVQEEKSRRNFLLPIVEIVVMDAGINLVVFYTLLGSGGFGAIR